MIVAKAAGDRAAPPLPQPLIHAAVTDAFPWPGRSGAPGEPTLSGPRRGEVTEVVMWDDVA